MCWGSRRVILKGYALVHYRSLTPKLTGVEKHGSQTYSVLWSSVMEHMLEAQDVVLVRFYSIVPDQEVVDGF